MGPATSISKGFCGVRWPVHATLPADRKYDGFDLMPMLTGTTDKSPRQEFAYYNGLTLEAVRSGPWKLHLPRKSARHVYWAQQPKKIHLKHLKI